MYSATSERNVVLALLVGWLGFSCANPITMDVPDGFLQLETSTPEIKATSPEDARIWVRDFQDRDQGDLEFWVEALRADLLRQRGYTLVDEGPMQDSAGHSGAWLRFSLTLEGEPRGYLVGVFVIEGSSSHTIRVAEFMARTEVFEQDLDNVKHSFTTIRS